MTDTIRVLMIEDDQYYYRFVRHMLMRHAQPKFQLAHAASVAQSTRYLLSETPDVILLDLGLPDAEGLETLAKVREVADGTPIVILTGRDDEHIAVEAVSSGAQDYLVKQAISNESLVRSLRYAIDRRKSEEATLRLTAIQDFMATLAHDLKIPLIGNDNVFQSFLSGQIGELSPEQEQVLRDLKESNKKQLQLVHRLLEIYRYEASPLEFKLETIETKTIITKCVASLLKQSSWKAGIKIIVPDGLPPILGNSYALTVLLTNLLDNAIKFSAGSRDVSVGADQTGNKIELYVHNFGLPIPEEEQARLFRTFFQGVPGKRYVARTGLGLYLCHCIASLHRGKITCTSTARDGTTITVRLPADISASSPHLHPDSLPHLCPEH